MSDHSSDRGALDGPAGISGWHPSGERIGAAVRDNGNGPLRSTIHSSTPVALLAIDDAGIISSCDPSFATLFSVPASIAVAGGSVDDLVRWFEEKDESMSRWLAAIRAPNHDPRGELRTTDGRIVVWHRTTLTGADERRGAVVCCHEVGGERASLQALRDAEDWLHVFAAQTRGAVIELDVTGLVIGTWSAYGEILTLPEAQLHGRRLGEILDGKYAGEFEHLVHEVVATRIEASLEYVAHTMDEPGVFSMTATARTNDEGATVGVSVLVRDISEQTRMQTKLVQAERLASVGLLAAGVAHEINNPLTYMVLNFQRVRRGIHQLGELSKTEAAVALSSELERCIDMMVEGAERVQEIVSDLQRFSRSDRGDLRDPVDVTTVLKFTVGMVSFELERHARLVCELGPVPLVLATEGRLSQVFLNLILNAVQSLSAPDPRKHEIRLVTMTDEGGRAVVEVHDTGVGIGVAEMRKIFDPFYTTKAPNVGTGLGLSICHGIVRSLGGEITVDSKVGVGTVFRVTLPPAPSVS